ncbi:hypothetical protein Hdeb2414_s0015g00438771 [Helianthus debilis subsp. tardiflorus]
MKLIYKNMMLTDFVSRNRIWQIVEIVARDDDQAYGLGEERNSVEFIHLSLYVYVTKHD